MAMFMLSGSMVSNAQQVTDNYLKALIRFEPWAESVWKDYPSIPGAGYFGDGQSGGNGGIRGTAGIALAYAVLVREFPGAPEYKRRLAHLQATLKFAEETHQSGPAGYVATDGKKWGAYAGIDKKDKRIWQSAMWAATMGFAAALTEKQLDPAVVAGCKKVIAAEADLLSTIPPPTGFRSDSKGEENAWNTSVPALAAAWMPNDSRAGKWLLTAKLYLANTYSVPADTTGPLKKWISTQTLFPSFAMENHGFYHPSYQAVAGMSMGDTYAMVRFVNPQLCKQLEPFTGHNVLAVWNFIKDIVLDSGDLAFPSGLDWSLHSFEHISYLAYLTTRFKNPQAAWAEKKLSAQILYRQQINGNGAFVGESCPDNFYREAVEAVRIATAYLHHQLAGFPRLTGEPIKPRLINYPDVGLLLHRTGNLLFTISYGSKVTSLVYPLKGKNPRQDFITSPNIKSLIGGQGKAEMKNYRPTSEGFKAELIMTNAKGNNSHIYIQSNKECVALIQVFSKDIKQQPANWYLMAIENHALTGGKRTVYWDNGSAVFKERSGTPQKDINSGWVNIDNWLGMAAQPAGNFIYSNAKAYNRNGAAEDAILYGGSEKQRVRAIIIVPGCDRITTARLQKSSRLQVADGIIKFIYTTPKSKKEEMIVSSE